MPGTERVCGALRPSDFDTSKDAELTSRRHRLTIRAVSAGRWRQADSGNFLLLRAGQIGGQQLMHRVVLPLSRDLQVAR